MIIELGGKTRTIKFDYNSICDMEEKANMGIPQIMSENAGFNTLRLLMWSGLKHENRGLTLDMVGLWIQKYLDEGNELEKLYSDVAKALMDSGIMGKNKEGLSLE
jgi:hypothetical protein